MSGVMAVESLASDLIASLDKRLLLGWLRMWRSNSQDRTVIDTVNFVIREIESGKFDG